MELRFCSRSGAADIADPVALLGVAVEAGLAGDQWRHVAGDGAPAVGDQFRAFAGALFEGLECVGFPGVGAIARVDRLEAGQMDLDSGQLAYRIGYLARHVGRVEQGQAGTVARLEVAVGYVEVGVGRRIFGQLGVDAAVAGVPQAHRIHHPEHLAALAGAQFEHLTLDHEQVPGQRGHYDRAPQGQRNEPVAAVEEEAIHGTAHGGELPASLAVSRPKVIAGGGLFGKNTGTIPVRRGTR
jgi:hypothetical protein